MTDDLVKRLRSLGRTGPGRISFLASEDAMKAADLIKKLEALVEQLRDDNSSLVDDFDKTFLHQESRIKKLAAALLWYAEHCQKGGDDIEGPYGDYGQRARNALEGKDD